MAAAAPRDSRHSAMHGESGFQRVEGDRYWTEPWVTRALLARVKFRGMIWEPAAGRGDMVNVLSAAGYKVMASDIAGASLGCSGAAETDFLACGSPGDATFSICTNPPYDRAEAFIRKALDLTQRSGGMVAMLLRNEYDCAAGRRDLFEREAFASKLVLTKRPRWLDDLAQHSARGGAKIGWLP
jgi:hypothetical protein